MSILIKGMEMPKNCEECPCINGENGYCQMRKEYVHGDIPRSCPLIELPPHGRLIDADALKEDWLKLKADGKITDLTLAYWLSQIIDAPTIIEAETCNNTEDACNKDVDTPVNASKTGKWIERGNCEYKCSICGKIVFADDENELNYCCNCGARMAKE